MRRGRLGDRGLSVLVCAVALFLVLPTFIVVPMSFSGAEQLSFPPSGFSMRWYVNYVSDPQWRLATLNTLLVALGATVLATCLGTLAALGLLRGRVPFRQLLIGVFLLPMIVPTIVTAVGTYGVFARFGLAGTVAGMILGHTILALPFVFINVAAVLQRVNWVIEQAARSLGATATRAFLLVVLPTIMPGVVAGAIFAFLTSFDEVVVALFLSGVRAVTLPVQMWSGIRFEINPTVAAVSVVLVIVSSLLFAVMSRLRKEAP